MAIETLTYKKTTPAHFALFKKECEKWIKNAGLFGWRFHYQHKDLDAEIEQSAYAYIIYPDQLPDRVFTIGLSKSINYNFTNTDIRKSAFHEIMEALLYRIYFLAKARYIVPEDVDEEIHNIIRILEHMMFK